MYKKYRQFCSQIWNFKVITIELTKLWQNKKVNLKLPKNKIENEIISPGFDLHIPIFTACDRFYLPNSFAIEYVGAVRIVKRKVLEFVRIVFNASGFYLRRKYILFLKKRWCCEAFNNLFVLNGEGRNSFCYEHLQNHIILLFREAYAWFIFIIR